MIELQPIHEQESVNKFFAKFEGGATRFVTENLMKSSGPPPPPIFKEQSLITIHSRQTLHELNIGMCLHRNINIH